MAFSEEILIRMGFDNSKVDRGLRSTKQKAKESADSIGASFKKLGGTMTAIFSFAALTKGFKSLLDLADQLSTKANTIGVSAEFLQRFAYAADQTGVATDKAEVALTKMVQKIGLAKTVGGEYAKIFELFGIRADGKSVEEIMLDISEIMAGMPSDIERNALAMKLFEEGGADLISTLKQGPDALRKLMDEATVLTEAQIKQLDKVDKKWKQWLTSMKIIAGGEVADILAGLEEVETASKSGGGIMGAVNAIGSAGWELGIGGTLARIGRGAPRSEMERGEDLDSILRGMPTKQRRPDQVRDTGSDDVSAGIEALNLFHRALGGGGSPYGTMPEKLPGGAKDSDMTLEEIMRMMKQEGIKTQTRMGD